LAGTGKGRWPNISMPMSTIFRPRERRRGIVKTHAGSLNESSRIVLLVCCPIWPAKVWNDGRRVERRRTCRPELGTLIVTPQLRSGIGSSNRAARYKILLPRLPVRTKGPIHDAPSNERRRTGEVLEVARRRPLLEAMIVRTGPRKGERYADVRDEVRASLDLLGRERVLVYKTLLLTGLQE
jgi:hypothetical protein